MQRPLRVDRPAAVDRSHSPRSSNQQQTGDTRTSRSDSRDHTRHSIQFATLVGAEAKRNGRTAAGNSGPADFAQRLATNKDELAHFFDVRTLHWRGGNGENEWRMRCEETRETKARQARSPKGEIHRLARRLDFFEASVSA